MRLPTRTWRAIPWPGALLALLAWGLVAPSEAEAGCRHPGLAASGAASALDRLERLMAADEAPAPRPTAPEPPAPCKGPSCSGQSAPAPTPTSAPTNPEQRWALGTIPPPTADPASEPAPRDDARLHPAHAPLGIFHPPRLPASLS